MKRPAPAGQMKQPQQARGVQTFAKGGTAQWVPEDDHTCPLCIEPMDLTDMNFRPCPCGYLMCLFCYQKVVEMCNSVCPNCRREYGSAMEDGEVCNNNAGAPYAPEQQQRITTPQHAAGRGGGAGDYHAGGAAGAGGAPLHVEAGPVRAAATVFPAQGNNRNGLAGPAHARPRGAEGAGGAAPGRGARAEDAPALPSGAVWATQAKPAAALQQDNHEPRLAVRGGPPPTPAPAPVIADTSAWPDLAAAVAPPPPPPPPHPRPQKEREPSPSTSHANLGVLQQRPQHQQQQQAAQQQQPEQHNAEATAVAPHTVPRMDSITMACDPVVSPEQLGLQPAGSVLPPHAAAGGYPSVQVSTQVLGSIRNVSVVLSPNVSPPEVYPGGPALLADVDKRMTAGEDGKEGGKKLLAFIRSHQPHATAAPRQPPPGFSDPVQLNPADSPVVPSPPNGRFQPIGRPMGPPPGMGGFNAAPGGNNNNTGRPSVSRVPHVPGTYSLWGGPRPAIDLGANSGVSLNNWLGGASSGAAAPQHDGLQAGALGGGFASAFNGFGGSLLGNQANNNAMAPLLNKPPPPGFGPAPQPFSPQPGAGAGEPGILGLGQQNVANDGWYNPLGSSFNFAAARGPPPGMTAVYR